MPDSTNRELVRIRMAATWFVRFGKQAQKHNTSIGSFVYYCAKQWLEKLEKEEKQTQAADAKSSGEPTEEKKC